MNLSWTVANIGTGPTRPGVSWTDAVYMSPDPTLDSNAMQLGTFPQGGPLAAGGSYTPQTVTLPVGVSGSFYFLVQTDVNGQVFQNGATADNVAATTRPRPST